jgi:hypothetical protein
MKKLKTTIGMLTGLVLVLACAARAEAQTDRARIRLGSAGPMLTVTQPRVFESLAIYPLVVDEVTDGTRYKHLDKAVSDKSVMITEWGSGTVPNLKVANKGKGKVFIMTGEIMTGAKQDRMSAHDVLLRPGSGPVKLPVYCVEQGRWVKNSDRFAAGRTAGTKKLRKSAVAKASQSRIWSDVAEKSAKSGVRSSTGTMQAVYNDGKVKKKISAYEKAFADLPTRTPDMVGFVVAVRGQIGNADLFANPPLLEGLWQKLVKAAATDAVTEDAPALELPTPAQVRNFLGAGIGGDYKPVDNPGLGQEFLVTGAEGVSGSTLIHDSSVVHMALFAPDKSDGPRELQSGIQYQTAQPQPQPQPQWSNSNTIGNGAPAPWHSKGKKKNKGKSQKKSKKKSKKQKGQSKQKSSYFPQQK